MIDSRNIKTEQLNAIVENYVKNNSIVAHQINSMDDFQREGIKLIVTQFFTIETTVENIVHTEPEDKDIKNIQFKVVFTDVKIDKPMVEGQKAPLLPSDARKKDLSYLARLRISATITARAFKNNGTFIERSAKIKDIFIANLPIMVGTHYCHTYKLPKNVLSGIGEDPQDPQAHFILAGQEWYIANVESRKYNTPHVFRSMHKKEYSRVEFIGIPGDSFENSSEIIVRYLNTGEIVVRLTSDKYFKVVEFPFYVIFKLLGMLNEHIILQNIIYSVKDSKGNINEINKHMLAILSNAFKVKYENWGENLRFVNNHSELRKYCINVLAKSYVAQETILERKEREKQEDKERIVLESMMMQNLDNNLFPQQGKGIDHRFTKARYLGSLVRKLLLVYLKIIPSTNRDSQIMKRIHASGDSFSKMFKKEFNSSIVLPVRNQLGNSASRMSFSKLDLGNIFEQGIQPKKLQTALERALNAGMGTRIENGREVKNRVPSEQLNRKNYLNVYNSLGNVRTPNSSSVRQNERADQMRRVDPTQMGALCPAQTQEGTSVGLVKNLTVGTLISTATSSEIMKAILYDNKFIIPLEKLMNPAEIYLNNMVKVFCNGYWIGFAKNVGELYRYFAERRRGWDITTMKRVGADKLDRKMTMYWNTLEDEIDFRTDRGRLLTPYVVVRNNTRNDPIGQKIFGSKFDEKKYKHRTGEEWKFAESGFVQDILVTAQHIKDLQSGKIKMEELVDQGYIDYISPEELTRSLIAENIEVLHKNRHNPLIQYTHCAVPISLISLTSASSPFLQTAPPTRIAIQTNQARQTCSRYINSFDKRFDKPGIMQIHNEVPIVPTITNHFVPSNGQMTMVAIGIFKGYNMEDSLELNKASAERGCYDVWQFTYEKTKLEKDEEFGIPNQNTTSEIKSDADYTLLDKKTGFIRKNVWIEKGVVLAGKLTKITQSAGDGKIHRDSSLIYRGKERAYVCAVEHGIDARHDSFVKIRLAMHRPMDEGHKFASRCGQKGMTAKKFCQSEMMFTESGLSPTLVLSPHAIPSRMTINQLIESLYNNLGASCGSTFDGTFGVCTNVESVGKKLETIGLNRYGTERMYNGYTGESMDVELFFTPVYYQRLQKFYEETAYSIGSNGPVSFETRQPVSGKAHGGGLRIGEMEKDAINMHSAGSFLTQKFRHDSDGFNIHVCRNCSHRAIANERRGIYICRVCGDRADIVEVPTRFACHLLWSEFEAMGVGVKMTPKKYEINLDKSK